jgi:beta-mannosidase
MASCAPGAVEDVAGLDAANLTWTGCSGPMTAAAALREAGTWSLDGVARRFDAEDWWVRTRFAYEPSTGEGESWLCFDGLATIADVWLNGAPLLSVEGMFTAHACPVNAQLRAENELVMRFHALDAALAVKRPRPRWRVPMLDAQQYRWFRTTLLGRTPGWSPPVAAVGPWRGIRLEQRQQFDVEQVALRAYGTGALDVAVSLRALDATAVTTATLVVRRAAYRYQEPIVVSVDGAMRWQRVMLPDVVLWWPHTHGEPALYDVSVELLTDRSDAITLDLGRVGFRTIEVRRGAGDFEVVVNGVSIFCRGACWTPLDVVSLDASDRQLDEAFEQLVDAGLNMVRVGGTMIYESDAFLDRCDARGVLLWQDLMFANMDYPEDDAAFVDRVRVEVGQQLQRLAGRPSVAVICGNGEVEQQAAMWGAARERWSPPLFHQLLPALVEAVLPGVAYWPSSAHGGDFPHQGNVGTTSYFGVGAYLRPLEDARRAEIRFATECLAFANIPPASTLAALPGGAPRVRDAVWRARAPRDRGASWDFDDVRDHYFALIYGMAAASLCASDESRYLELSREVPGEVMRRTIGEWRRKGSVTRGALVWFLRDLWPGAGWGIVDASGRPKAAWYHLRRACAPVAVHISDEGGNGLALHVVNDAADTLHATLELAMWRDGEINVGRATQHITVPGRGGIERNAVALLDAFHDLSYAYRFGPPPQDLVSLRLVAPDGSLIASAHHFIGAIPVARDADIGLSARAHRADDGAWLLTVATRRVALHVQSTIPGYRCSDEHFHLVPGEERTLRLMPSGIPVGIPVGMPVEGTVSALNTTAAIPIGVE